MALYHSQGYKTYHVQLVEILKNMDRTQFQYYLQKKQDLRIELKFHKEITQTDSRFPYVGVTVALMQFPDRFISGSGIYQSNKIGQMFPHSVILSSK